MSKLLNQVPFETLWSIKEGLVTNPLEISTYAAQGYVTVLRWDEAGNPLDFALSSYAEAILARGEKQAA